MNQPRQFMGIGDPAVAAIQQYTGEAMMRMAMSPLRRAFLLDQGDLEQLGLAMSGALTLWGGARSVVMPIDSEGRTSPRFRQIAKLLRTDRYVDIRPLVDGSRQHDVPHDIPTDVIPARPFDDGRFWSLHPLAVLNSEPPGDLAVAVPDDQSLVSLAGAGQIIEPDRQDWTERNVRLFPARTATDLAIAQCMGQCVSRLSVAYDAERTIAVPAMQSVTLLWLVDDPDSFDDAVVFWNLRALRPHGWGGGISIFATTEVARQADFRDALREQAARTSRSNPSVIISSLSVDNSVLQEIGLELGLYAHEGSRVSEKVGSMTGRDSALDFAVGIDPGNWWAGERLIGPAVDGRVNLVRPRISLRMESPIAWNSSLYLTGYVTARLSGNFVVGPRRDSVARLYVNEGTWDGDEIRVITNNTPSYDWNLGVPTPEEVLQTACGEAGTRYQPSDKAQQIVGVLGRVGEFGFYRTRSMIAVAQTLTQPISKEILRKLDELASSLGEQDSDSADLRGLAMLGRQVARTLQEIKSSAYAATLSQEMLTDAAEELVGRGLAARVLRVDCGRCGLLEFQDIALATSRAMCAGCGTPATYSPGNRPVQIRYRLNSLLQRVCQNGGLAVLAAVAKLSDSATYLVPGADLYQNDGTSLGEVDLLGWRRGELFVGEVKTSARGFAEQSLDAEVSKAKAVAADTYIAACLEQLDDSIVEDISSRFAATGIKAEFHHGADLVTG
jgi:hypothetical protein